ncbi:RUS1 family protein C16orf58 [Chelonus insularis]|uniref:RUS1 family protein C16orf58 n=1 Tax=Chelonus insularis TaxID=460826 RepID=UPI001588FA4E|nr:RUS1 family protein C16orf58 [Chelonus insularis]
MVETIEIQEYYENYKKLNISILKNDKLILKESQSWKISFLPGLSYLRHLLKEVFLPQGFPDSVHPDYVPYQIWDTIQAFASTIIGTLTTHSILQGVGVGKSTATPLAAAISWILKDGTGMIGRILFAWWKGSDLDSQSKKWRLLADILNDIAMGIELILPYFSQTSITILLCISTSMKSIVGVAGAATRAALTQHQALTNNLADVSAKDGSQETFVNLIASVMGILILLIIENSYIREIYLILVLIHIYANYSAVKSLRLSTLNEDRLVLLLKHYYSTKILLDTKKINSEESLLFFNNTTKKQCGFHIKLGISIFSILKNQNQDFIKYVRNIILHNQNHVYLIVPDYRQKTIYISLKHNVQPSDILEAYFKAFFYGNVIKQFLKNDSLLKCTQNEGHFILSKILVLENSLNKEFLEWYELLRKSEWNHEHHLLPVKCWRGIWSVKN